MHPTGFHLGGMDMIVLVLVVADGLYHGVLHSGFSLGRWGNLRKVDVERLRPVPFPLYLVFSLDAGGDNAERGAPCHIHGGLYALGDGGYIVSYFGRERVDGKGHNGVSAEGERFFPA